MANPLQSQTRTIRAVIVYASGDTLTTEIQNDPVPVLQKGIRYKQPGSALLKTVLPDSLKSVTIEDGRVFETVTCDSASCLLLSILKGYYNLYQKEESKNVFSYYLFHLNDKPYHLYETISVKEIEGAKYKRSNYEYIRELKLAMADKLELSDEIHALKFDGKEITGIVKKYNKLKGDSYHEERAKFLNGIVTEKGILAGVNYFYFDDPNPGIRAGLDLVFRKKYTYSRRSINTGILYSRTQTKLRYGSEIFHGLEIPVLFNYRLFDFHGAEPFVSCGISVISCLTITKFDFSTYDTRESSAFFLPSIGCGAKFNIGKSALKVGLNTYIIGPGNLSVVFVF